MIYYYFSSLASFGIVTTSNIIKLNQDCLFRYFLKTVDLLVSNRVTIFQERWSYMIFKVIVQRSIIES